MLPASDKYIDQTAVNEPVTMDTSPLVVLATI